MNPTPSSPSAALLVVLSAPSGGGKTTLSQSLLASYPNMTRAVTCTTRNPRPGEREGVDYYFMDTGAFLIRIEAGEFLEHATVYGQYYGLLKSEILGKLQAGRDVVLSVDVQGAATLRRQAQSDPTLRQALVTVFVTPPTLAELEQRLTGRGQDAPEVIRQRLAAAAREIQCWQDFDYVILSGTREEDLRRTRLIIEAEKLRSVRNPIPAIA